MKWIRKAAGQNWPAAQFELGRALLAGDGAERNEAEGRTWIEKSAALGHEPAVQYLAQVSRSQGAPPVPAASAITAAAQGAPKSVAPPTQPLATPVVPELTAAASAPVPKEPAPLPFTPPPTPKPTEPAAAPAPVKPVAPETAKEPSLPPFTAPLPPEASPKAAVTPPPTRDMFTLPATGADTNSSGAFTDPPRAREPQLPIRDRELAPVAANPAMGSADMKWIAIISALISAAILFLGIYMLYAFQTRLRGLEAELKKAQFELSKANVNLSAMMHQVEQLALAAPPASAKPSLPEWNPEPAKAHTTSFKMNRSK